MLPHLGQGANQSIEDGMALATLLAATRGEGRRYDYDDLDERDAEMADSERFRHWLYDHDVLLEAEEQASALRRAPGTRDRPVRVHDPFG